MADIVTRDTLMKMRLVELDALSELVSATRKEKAIALKQDVKSRVEAMIREAGSSVAELFGYGGADEPKSKRTNKSAGTKTPFAAKFKHPENDTITWSGRGRRPDWFAAHLEAGKNADDLLIK